MSVCNLLVQRGPSKSMSWCKPASSVKYCENVFTGSYSEQKAATDPTGGFTLTLTNLVIGSSVQVETQDGTTVFHNSVTASTSLGISLSAYTLGSALNDLRIKVRKGTASPFYQPFETLTTAIVGSQSIYVAQIADE